MKSLAFVAIIFLPGSFVSALFAIGFFEWDDSSSGVFSLITKPSFALYWMITIPLTLLVLALHSLWLIYHRVRQEKLQAAANLEAGLPDTFQEVKLLKYKRNSLN